MGMVQARDEVVLPSGWIIEDGQAIPFWWTKTGVIVKYSILAGIFLLTTLFLVGSYVHAKRRLRRGLQPLGYHRWLVASRVDPEPGPYYAASAPYPRGAYNMYHMAPPPVYDPTRPPVYEGAPGPGPGSASAPPPAGTKVDPSQWTGQPTRRPDEGAYGAPDYQPPPGPPPPSSTRPPMP